MIIFVILSMSKGGCWISDTNIGAWPLSYMKTRGGGEGVGTTPYSGWIILCSLLTKPQKILWWRRVHIRIVIVTIFQGSGTILNRRALNRVDLSIIGLLGIKGIMRSKLSGHQKERTLWIRLRRIENRY